MKRILALAAFLSGIFGPASAWASHASRPTLFRVPPLTDVILGSAWLGAATLADQVGPSWTRTAAAYVGAGYLGTKLGTLAGGLMGNAVAGSDTSNWGPPFAGMILGGIAGFASGMLLASNVSSGGASYYATQAAGVLVFAFTLPIF